MDEAEKCTDLAYINLGKLLYSGTTRDLVSFSHIKAYRIIAERDTLNTLSEAIAQTYPDLLITMVNNDLRISSNKAYLLEQWVREEKNYSIEEVMPNFEEVFIGLMK